MIHKKQSFGTQTSGYAWLAALLLILFLASYAGAAGRVLQAKTTRQVPVDSLIYDLKNPDAARRREAAKLLGDNKIQRATPALVAAAGDSDPQVRREIVIALDKMLDMRALPAFVKLSSDSQRDIRERCILGIINLYLPQESGLVVTLNRVANFFNPWSDEWSDVVVEPYIKVDPSAVKALIDRLQDSDEGIRVKAAQGLGILKSSASLPALLETLRADKSNSVRFEAVRSMRKIGDPSVVPELINFLNYNDKKVRDEAIFTIGRLRYHQAVPELMRIYERESARPERLVDEDYLEHLLDALAFIGDPASKELFVKEMQNPEDTFRLHAFEGIARLADPSLVTETSRARLHEENPKIRTAQAYALYRMGRKEYLDEVVQSLSDGKTNQEAKQNLVELRPDELPELYAQISNPDVNVREGLAEILGLVGDDRAIPALQELSKDQRGQIAALANQALRRINARTAAR